MKTKEFIKGQTAYVHSRSERQSSYETTVVSIGKKYITCQQRDGYPKQRFDKETFIDNDWSNYVLYHSKEEYEHEIEIFNMRSKIYWHFDKLIDILTEEEVRALYEKLTK